MGYLILIGIIVAGAFVRSGCYVEGAFSFLFFLGVPISWYIYQKKTTNEKEMKEARDMIEKEEIEYKRKQELISRYQALSPEDIILNGDIEYGDRIYLLQKVHKYSSDEVEELFNTVRKEAKKAKLNMVKGRITGKIKEFYGRVSFDEERAPISDEVKMYVWQRDGGKCVKCGSQEKLEYDHIIPFSKGGSNSERNIQILCEKCNKEKRDNIV